MKLLPDSKNERNSELYAEILYFNPSNFHNLTDTDSFSMRWLTRAPSRSRKPLRLAYYSLRLASRLAVVSTAAA